MITSTQTTATNSSTPLTPEARDLQVALSRMRSMARVVLIAGGVAGGAIAFLYSAQQIHKFYLNATFINSMLKNAGIDTSDLSQFASNLQNYAAPKPAESVSDIIKTVTWSICGAVPTIVGGLICYNCFGKRR